MRQNIRPTPIWAVVTISCKMCGNEFKAQKSANRKYCSNTCSSNDPDIIRRISVTRNGNPNNKAKNYSRGASGWVEIGGKRFFARSSWEANYGRYLQWMKENDQISDWEHEPKTFWFEGIKRGCRSYLPDYLVSMNDGTHEWHEVKGWMDAKSVTKLKRMDKYYPEETVRVFGSVWFKDANKKLANIIPGWTGKVRLKSEERTEITVESPGWTEPES